MKAKKSAAIKSHQCFGALRIGTLRDHESVALLVCLDANLHCNVAYKRKLLTPSSVAEKAPKQRLTGNSAERCRKLTFAGKNYESLLSRARLLVCFQSPFWQSTCLIPQGKMNGIHSNGENNFAATRIKTKIRPGFVSKWRNGPCFRYMAARPHTLSQLWRYLAAQTNILSAVSRL